MGILIILLLAESVNKSNWFTDFNCNITNMIIPKLIVVDSQNTILKENLLNLCMKLMMYTCSCTFDCLQIDCTTEGKKCTEHNIHAFPSLKLFKDGREVG